MNKCELHWRIGDVASDGSCAECARQREQRERRAAAMSQAAQETAANNHALSPRFRAKTLDNFRLSDDQAVVGRQKAAIKKCRDFVDAYPNRAGLVFIGGNGAGKNHLACGIVNELQRRRGSSFTALVTTAYGLIVDLKATWDKPADGEPRKLTHDQLLAQVKKYDIVVIDEIDQQFGSDTDRLLLTHIVNLRYEWQRPTIFIGNIARGDLRKHLGDRVIDRMFEGDAGTEENPEFVVSCVWPSYRRRTAGVA